MASFIKRLTRSRLVVRFAADTIALYIRLVYWTSRWETVGAEHPDAFWREGRPFVGAFWHGRLLMMPVLWTTTRPMHVLISRHRDGELIARAMDRFGLHTVRGSAGKAGSSEKGGLAALRSIRQILKGGDYVTFTPDGPRGPRMRASTGTVAAARLAGVPIVPATYSVRRRTVASSWDRFIIPWPFNRGVLIWGEPVDVSDPEESLEAATERVEQSLNRLCEAADRICGQQPIEPAARISNA